MYRNFRIQHLLIVAIILILISGCSNIRYGKDIENTTSMNDVVFTTAFCVPEKTTLKERYFIWKDCYTTKLSNTACTSERETWHIASDKYISCRDPYLNENLLINPFHIYRK